MSEMKVTLEACEPMELMRNAIDERVWIRHIRGNYWPDVEIRGEQEEIYNFIKIHWDVETAEEMVYGR